MKRNEMTEWKDLECGPCGVTVSVPSPNHNRIQQISAQYKNKHLNENEIARHLPVENLRDAKKKSRRSKGAGQKNLYFLQKDSGLGQAMMGAKKRASLSPEVQRSTGFQGGEGMGGGEEVEKPPAARPRRGHIVTVKYWKFVDNPSFYH